MKKNLLTKILAFGMVTALAATGIAGCGSSVAGTTDTKAPVEKESSKADTENTGESAENADTPAEHVGTMMWLSNLSSGAQYDAYNVYLEELCSQLGYDLTVVYGDAFNDAAGNLSAVKNGMTNDVVGLIASQDGGLSSIMEEYPNLYVAGFNTDMNSVYGEGGENTSLLENKNFLGTLCDGHADGADMAQVYFDTVVAQGYKKLAIVNFPSYAYPNQGAADSKFKELVEEYNGTATDGDKIELVGETTTLEFAVLEDSWFLENGHDDLDCIVSFCAGFSFVYPTVVSAKANGSCAADTKIITGGFERDESIIADIGEDGTIAMVDISPIEDCAFPVVLIDNAIHGTQFADWTNGRVDSYDWIIDSKADIDNVMNHSILGTVDIKDAQIPVADMVNLCTKNNSEATYADLVTILTNDETISVDNLAK